MEQIKTHGWLNDETMGLAEQNAPKNSLHAFVFNVLDFDNRRIRIDNKKIHEIKELLKNSSAVLKPDKGEGEGVVIISKMEYKNSMESLSSDHKRFRVVKEDLTTSRLANVQTPEVRSTKTIEK